MEYSLNPGIIQPYSEYDLIVRAEGFEPLAISGTEILADSNAIQPAAMTPLAQEQPPEDPVVIPDHTLYGNYPPKIAEDEVKPVNESGEIVLSRVVIPQTIVVHDGVPTDSTAKNYYVPYRDYIKNVAYLAGKLHYRQCTGDYVLYPKSCVHRVVQKSGL